MKTTRLHAQRLVRAAVRSSNQMIAGSRIQLITPATGANAAAIVEQLLAVLTDLKPSKLQVCTAQQMHSKNSPRSPVDFVFCPTDTTLTQLPTAPASKLPPVIVVYDSNGELTAAGAQQFATSLQAAGMVEINAPRPQLREFAITGGTAISDAPSCVGQSLALCHPFESAAHSTDAPTQNSAAAKIAWAQRGMPATTQMVQQLGDLSGEKILVSLILEPKTACLALLLQTTGAEVAVFAPACETDPEIAYALQTAGITVFAATSSQQLHTNQTHTDAQHAAQALAWAPTLLIDDGAHLIRLAHTSYPTALKTLRGAAEETTSGVRPLLQMQTEQKLKLPVVLVNNARTKTLFDNRVGTGESCVHAILDLLDTDVWHTPWVIWGYGPVGEGAARAARAYSKRVLVIETDPVRALAAVTDGFELTQETQLPVQEFIAVSATGVLHTITAAAVRSVRNGVILAVAGGVDNEIALDELAALGYTWQPVRCGVQQLVSPDGQLLKTLLLAQGGGVNYTAAEGNPLMVMDLSFATQCAALEMLMMRSRQLENGVHAISAQAEACVAAAALAATGNSVSPGQPNPSAELKSCPWQAHRYRQDSTMQAAGN